MNYKFKDQQLVSFYDGIIKGTGKIVGCMTTGHAVIGCTYAVEVISSDLTLPNDTYPFKVIAVCECHLDKEDEA